MPISEADALAIHNAIHGGEASVTLASGESLPVTKNSSRFRIVNLPDFTAAEQNKYKPSEWGKKAKAGAHITWFMGGKWGRIVDGVIEDHGTSIVSGGAAADAGAAVKKRPAAAACEAEEEDEEVEEPPPEKKARTRAPAASSSEPAAKEVKTRTPAASSTEPPPPAASSADPPAKGAESSEPAAKKAKTAEPAAAAASASPSPAVYSGSDPLCLAPIFAGKGYGAEWLPILAPLMEKLPNAAAFIGPGRDKRIVPVRELTFQALKPTPPSGWTVVSLGQSPFPRIESATGIAHFDNAISSWKDSRFGIVVTMRCIIKAAAMNRFGVPKGTSTDELRALLKKENCVGPAEWFQAMLTQGVLFMNAACTLLPPEDKSIRAGTVVEEHRKFWAPVIGAIIEAILKECSKQGRGIVFAWWGAESMKTRKGLQQCLSRYPDVVVKHVEGKNPAAMGDAFCDNPNIFLRINEALESLGLRGIDWLPSAGWQGLLTNQMQVGGGQAEEMADFITETQELHKMYLERLKDGLDKRDDDLPDIVGIMEQPLVSLAAALKPLKLEGPAAASVTKAGKMTKGELSLEEAAAVHMYTTNHLYKMLNEALRSPERAKVERFFLYLKLLLTALHKLPAVTQTLYRGVALDLSKQYAADSKVTWWAVSSCTKELSVANSFGGSSKSTLFVVDAKSGAGIKDFSEYKGEEEFVLAPGTQFKVEKVANKGKLTEVHLQELSGQCRVR